MIQWLRALCLLLPVSLIGKKSELETFQFAFFYRSELLEEFMDTAKASKSPALAIEVVKLASAFSLPVCESLAQRIMTDFTIDEKQK